MAPEASSQESARAAIAALVERYARNRDRYRSSTYNEETCRAEFITPLFEALGWDVTNKAGYAEQYKDLIHEEGIKVGDFTKAPDYTFRVAGVRKFFVEAKKPFVDLKSDPAPAYQLRRYAWSAKLPLSVLTDFEEIAVYDTRIRPKEGDKPSVGRILYLTYDELLPRLDELWGVFSKEAVLKGSFDRYAEETRGKRGTSEVDAEFLREIEGWRDEFARNIAIRNEDLSVDDLNFAVQTTIDRIIFLRIAEGRGAEPYGSLLALVNGADIYARLVALYRKADTRYNSGLFDFKADRLTTGLAIDDKVLKPILQNLYYPQSPYEFSVLPVEILGNVYEQFLGKVIRLTKGHRAVVEEKPEVKKAGGVYYTPAYIVDYIVKQTVGELCEGKSPKQMEKLRILDPACGSGSFLLRAYQELLDRHLAWYRGHQPEKHRKEVFPGPGGDWRLTTAEKRRIVLNNIYGVDIDRQAVEVTKLSLLLKVLEGENDETLKQHTLFGERALPSLEGNIKCGNSLIAPDYYEDEQAELIPVDERRRLNTFDWPIEFASILKSGGFDAVVGNPPYGADYDDGQKRYFQSRYVYRKGKPETYVYFLEKGISLLRNSGALGYITPNAWLTNHYGAQIRKFVLEETAIAHVVDLERTRVFQKAVVDTAIVVVNRGTPSSGHRVQVWRGTEAHEIALQFAVEQSRWAQDSELIVNTQADPREIRVIDRLERSGVTLDSLVEYSQGVIPYKTKEDGAENLYIAADGHGKDWRPLLESASQVRRYEVDAPEAYIRYGRWLWCAREVRFFTEPKILFHRLRKKLPIQLVGAIETTEVINRHSLSNLVLREGAPRDALSAVLGLFNSKLANWWFVKRYGVLMEVGGFKVGKIPLPKRWVEAYGRLSKLAEDVTALHRQLKDARSPHDRSGLTRQITSAEERIDRLVYELYDLSPEEIEVVEAATQT